jgi:transcriptional regulator GlxA family with amidase domain
MARPLFIALICYPGIQILDAAGPAAVFGAANEAAGKIIYDIQLLSTQGGHIRSSCGVTLDTRALSAVSPAKVHTALVTGGAREHVLLAMADQKLRRWMLKVAHSAVRFGSVCTGTFVLAAFGLLEGCTVATHWASVETLAKKYPDIAVDADSLFVVDGKLWTSAGVTTAIDMALALVEKDLGAEIASCIAQRLVLYVRRPGHQSQFSPMLVKKAAADHDYAALMFWLRENLDKPLDVASLATYANQSLRTFHRKFTRAVGQTPADFVEALRLDHARSLLNQKTSLKTIANQSGFHAVPRFNAAFRRRFGITPAAYRATHHS